MVVKGRYMEGCLGGHKSSKKQDRVDNVPLYWALSDILYQHMQIKSCYDLFVCA